MPTQLQSGALHAVPNLKLRSCCVSFVDVRPTAQSDLPRNYHIHSWPQPPSVDHACTAACTQRLLHQPCLARVFDRHNMLTKANATIPGVAIHRWLRVGLSRPGHLSQIFAEHCQRAHLSHSIKHVLVYTYSALLCGPSWGTGTAALRVQQTRT